MDYSIIDFVSLLGAVCLFLYGMKVMSEGLQKAAGDRLRNILGIMTRNRVTGVLTGIVITALIQSSSASTTMVVSFVNAGLMSLAQSMAVIFGANVGTTVTTWIISAFSFEVNISDYTLLMLAIAVPMLFMNKSTYKSMGEFLIGFCFLFMGLDLISQYVPDLKHNPQMLEMLKNYTSMGYGSVLIFFLVGVVLTMVVQSSAATFAITLIMCSQGWISFELGCAIVLGGNIGTTITPILASFSGNTAAKRTAVGHVMFNVLGSVVVLFVFYPFIKLVGGVTEMCIGASPLNADNTVCAMTPREQASTAFGLAMFPTVFNAINLMIMIWFTNLYVKAVCWIVPSKKKNEAQEDIGLKYIGRGLLSASELNIAQAQEEIAVYGDRVQRMLEMAHNLVHSDYESEEYRNLYNRLEKYEEISDRMEIEIGNYLNRVAEGKLSPYGKMRVMGMLRVVSEIESIADSCFNVGKILQRKESACVKFNDNVLKDIDLMFKLVSKAMTNTVALLHEIENPDEEKVIAAYNYEREINNYRNRLRDFNIYNINNKIYDYQAGIFFMDIISESEKSGDYMLNVVEGIKHQFKEDEE